MEEQQFLGDQFYVQKDIRRYFTEYLEKIPQKRQFKSIWQGSKRTLAIDYQKFFKFDQNLAMEIFQRYYKYQPILNDALTQFCLQYDENRVNDIREQDQNSQNLYVTFTAGGDGPNSPSIGLRDLDSHKLGRLSSLRGTVTRTTEVRPEVVVGAFRCIICKSFSKKIPQQFRYTEPKKCTFDRCDSTNFELVHHRSEFADFQKLRIQQEPGSIPAGGMPRSIDVILRNDNVEKGQPGDICKFIGYLCVVPEMQSLIKPGEKTKLATLNMASRGKYTQNDGIKGVKGFRQLNYRYVFIATNIMVQNNQFNEKIELNDQQQQNQNTKHQQNGQDLEKQQFSQQKLLQQISKKLGEQQSFQISQMAKNPNLYNDLAQSMFPSIFGHSEIKKALLLQLLAGIHKVTSNKINIRGDINILIVGDPSTAKSQFLKCVNKFVPRSVYTNGKTTSAAGLTASVSRDQNGNVSIEAGALMLADNGICCIDQFDKMDTKDQTAIHEAMEQQTISIAKAGVHATLNARTSILAAANPIFGRYDKAKSLKHNINLTAPIMSRFDLFFVICDEAHEVTDLKLCQFMLGMHRNVGQQYNLPKYDNKTLRSYISIAKKFKPQLTFEAAQKLRQCYRQLRASQMSTDSVSYRPTVRQLQSLIRLSEAYARLHLSFKVTKQHVEQVNKLIRTSIIRLQRPVELQEDEDEHQQLKQNTNAQFLEKNKDKKKLKKKFDLSYEHFERIKKCVETLFKLSQREQNTSQEDFQSKLSQKNIIQYIIAQQLENDQSMNSIDSYNEYKKLAKSIIRKLIADERMLMVVDDNQNEENRILKIHPNYNLSSL